MTPEEQLDRMKRNGGPLCPFTGLGPCIRNKITALRSNAKVLRRFEEDRSWDPGEADEMDKTLDHLMELLKLVEAEYGSSG